jgi:hypothetical protein
MSDNLSNHIVEKLERRWAARVAGEAAAWHSERPMHSGQETVVTSKGRLVPVSFKGRRMRGGTRGLATTDPRLTSRG